MQLTNTRIFGRIEIDDVAKSNILRHVDDDNYQIERLIYNVTTRFIQSYRTFYEIFGADALLNLIANAEVKKLTYRSLCNAWSEIQNTKGVLYADELKAVLLCDVV